jgi:transposase
LSYRHAHGGSLKTRRRLRQLKAYVGEPRSEHVKLLADYSTANGEVSARAACDRPSQRSRPRTRCRRPAGGWDNAKKVNGRKRHIAVDATGLVLAVVITAASVQGRDAARPLLWNLSRCCTRIRLAWADAAYSGKLTAWAASLKIRLEIVRKRDAHAFEVLPRRWVVERTLAWITADRHCARDYERLPESHEAMVLWAMTALMTQRLATQTLPPD